METVGRLEKERIEMMSSSGIEVWKGMMGREGVEVFKGEFEET